MKKVTKLRRIIKQDRENEIKGKKVHYCNINFEKPLNDLDKTLEIKFKDISMLEKEENKLEQKEALTDFNHELKINHNNALKWSPNVLIEIT
ncbi:12895_t:CDS:2 [Gigaspora margarita]|uniref:12895_t:CDS:1 n=1 Tax=Gigaspora margarita TaxID=4874 RepID=A0ABN7VI35_GIGMA|nr:12895_t:CDS:2 [Gigaspora margarita]